MTVEEWRQVLDRRREDAARMHATAPVADVLAVVLEELAAVNGTPEHGADLLLTPQETARRLGTSVRWVYAHSGPLGGRRLSRRCLRFPEAAVRRYLERRR